MKFTIKKLEPALLPRIARVLKAVGHPLRLQLLEGLAAGPCSVQALVTRLGQPQAIVSQHLKVMRTGGVVVPRRKGTHVIYSLAYPGLTNLLNCLASCQDHCRVSISPR
ncbi:MAG: winged helix-turn-helix transcriptional regulator [Candidatus Riflebacteria bacterium]|nr:winged helix-turn-helix transcriptional regulator [Candidatus Riflebacteria bacterium]